MSSLKHKYIKTVFIIFDKALSFSFYYISAYLYFISSFFYINNISSSYHHCLFAYEILSFVEINQQKRINIWLIWVNNLNLQA